jgi:hypothetical protein
MFQKSPLKKREVINTLLAMDRLSPLEKKGSLLYIPKSNHAYWSLLECMTTPFVAPSLAGIAMLEGLPDKTCTVFAFGYEYYQRPPSNESMCQKAKKQGFSQIIILPDEKLKHVKKIPC